MMGVRGNSCSIFTDTKTCAKGDYKFYVMINFCVRASHTPMSVPLFFQIQFFYCSLLLLVDHKVHVKDNITMYMVEEGLASHFHFNVFFREIEM